MQRSIDSVFPLRASRTHEVFGAGANSFAFALAARLGGQMMWIRERWEPTLINPSGFVEFIDPATVTLSNTENQTDTLAVAEDCLRSGALRLVVLRLNKPLTLTEGRRLQLAARDGKSTGLAIIPEGMGSNAAETRWHCTPVFEPGQNRPDSPLQKWDLVRNKSGTLGHWYMRWDRAARRINMVAPPGP
ncbi:hypothetical protein N6L24_08495 [Cognatishimia sp. SS12]|uniref:ImuA family protein n=1 Tax=Cognatishimia sp. SS12 TaxID=2979465 RepID=UPI0023308E80|nr:hypothetical protein [Cognatishimia sp. SS12]MDC0738318.1 hypothetical protein [Cognatishimia sp. SS12]